MEKTTLYLPEALHTSLRDAARRERRSAAELVREALTEYLSRRQRPRPRSVGAIQEPGLPPAREAKQWVRGQWDREIAERDARP